MFTESVYKENVLVYDAWFECFNDNCKEKYPLDKVIYNCEKCGSLLQVNHDEEKITGRSGEEWKKTFDDRKQRNSWPYGSGVWRFKEWVNPLLAVDNLVSMYEGESNLFWAERLGKEIGLSGLWIKLCGNSHTGSFKDLGMTVLVSQVKQMIAGGTNIRAVACASTGDTSASLAAYCASAGINSIVFLPEGKVSNEQLIQPLAHGSLVISLKTDFDGCMKIVQEVATDKSIYLANSKNSLRIEGQKTVAIEMCQQFDWQAPDVVVIPGGNLGNLAALGKGFLLLEKTGIIKKRPRIVCAQAEKANPLYRYYKNGFENFEAMQAESTYASAIQIGNPVSVHKAVAMLKEFDGIVEQASEEELAEACARGDKAGLYTCPHTGVALAALFKLIKKGEISKNEKVVVISTAHGLKFSNFKLRYHEQKLGNITSKHANLPVTLPANISAVKKILDEKLGRI